ncbi:MAG: ABC transporter permease [Lachnospiraceae bacterium]|nr:ABC transporter permease [Lachnospiraceae bacterium]
MLRYAVKRILQLIPVLLGVSLLIFTILYFTPGDPADIVLGENASEETKEEWRDSYGLNDSFVEQYVTYIWNIVTKGDFGSSYKSGQPVTKSILERFPTTFLLAVFCSSIAMIIGVLLGIVAANHQNSWIDTIARIFGMAGISMPVFWLGLLLIMLFSVRLQWFPVSGWYGPRYWVLPSICLGLTHAASLMRITRSSMLDCINQDYVRTARAKGQKEGVITRHHILRNALIPIITAAGNSFGVALGGAMVMEQIFSIPGLGRLMVESINNRDYPMVRGAVLLLAISFSLVNLAVDLLYAGVDPRIKAQFASKPRKKAQKEKAGEVA